MTPAWATLIPAAVARSGAGGSPDYYQGLATQNLAPGWARPERSLWPAPNSRFVPAVWRFGAAKAALELAGDYVPMALTERRNLLMINPFAGNVYPTAGNLVAAYQMIRPGEHADSHRHTPHALRAVLDAGPGVYTVVDGTRIAMAPDDVVLTPGGCWHGHANHGTQNAFWIDVLDVPLVHHLESMFFEQSEGDDRQTDELVGRSPFSVALPRDTRRDASKPAIVPLGNLLPTMAIDYVSLAAGTRTPAERMCANNLFVTLSGVCRIVMDDRVVAEHCTRGDVAAVPLWGRFSVEAIEEATLLRVSDRPVYENCGYFRRESD